MIISTKIERGQKPTEEQRQEIREAAKREPVYDEDAPELSLEQMQHYRNAVLRKSKKAEVTLELSQEDMDKARLFGEGYKAVLSRLLELAMNDKEMVRRAQL